MNRAIARRVAARTMQTLSVAAIALLSQSAAASVVAFEHLPVVHSGGISGSIPPSNSDFGIRYLADDFSPSVSGVVSRIEWWSGAGYSPSSGDPSVAWGVRLFSGTAIQNDSPPIQPNLPVPDVGQSVTFVFADLVSTLDATGFWRYSVDLPLGIGQDFYAFAGQTYWLGVGIETPYGSFYWDLAHSLNVSSGAEVGSAQPSIGGNSYDAVGRAGVFFDFRPCCGRDVDFAFRVTVVPEIRPIPEPHSALLLGGGLVALAGFRRLSGFGLS